MRHGETRNQRLVSSPGRMVEFEDTAGEVKFRMPATTTTRTVSERWCAGCKQWFQVDGIFGRLSWESDHGEHGARKLGVDRG